MVKRAFLAVFLATAAISLANAEKITPAEALSVPAGTLLHCRITGTLTTKLNHQGDPFTMTVAEPVSINGRVAIPAGATLVGSRHAEWSARVALRALARCGLPWTISHLRMAAAFPSPQA